MEREVYNLDSEGILVSFNGVQYDLTPLKLKHQEVADKLTSEDSGQVMEALYELLEVSGLPREVSVEITIDKAKGLVEKLIEISTSKKN